MKPRHDFASDKEYEKYLKIYFSGMAMQGFLSNITQEIGEPNVNEASMADAKKRIDDFMSDVAKKSVLYSDKLIKALNENQ